MRCQCYSKDMARYGCISDAPVIILSDGTQNPFWHFAQNSFLISPFEPKQNTQTKHQKQKTKTKHQKQNTKSKHQKQTSGGVPHRAHHQLTAARTTT